MVFEAKHALSFSELEQWALTDTATMRLLLACALGGVIGLDREYHHKPSGVRTNLLICFAAALFTYLSPLIAGELSTSKGQIASNIVQSAASLRDSVVQIIDSLWFVTTFALSALAKIFGSRPRRLYGFVLMSARCGSSFREFADVRKRSLTPART